MLHLGDITKISGYTAPITDCVVGGSPCQDLSIAGKRAGLDGERSGLFMEQIRIIKEMRDRDVRENGRTDINVRPRYMVWENVPGAFSSNKGEDFRIVLEETARIKEKDANVPMPNSGKWQTSGCILGDGWSIAWRVLDAQFWGVPQRRRRIALVADFGGHSAHEILFVRKSLHGHSQPSQPQRKATAQYVTRGIGADDRETAYTMKIRSGCDVDAHGKPAGKGALIQTEKSGTLSCVQDQYLFQPVGFDMYNQQFTGDVSRTLKTPVGGDDIPVCVYSVENHPADSRVDIDDTGKVQTLTSRMGTGGGNVPMVMEPTVFSKSRRAKSATDFETWNESDTANTLNTFDQGDVRTNECVIALDRASYNQGQNAQFDIGIDEKGTAQSLVAKGPGAVCYSLDPLSSNSMKSSNPHSGCHETDVARTIDTTNPDPSKNQGGVAVVEQVYTIGNGQVDGTDLHEKAGTLNCMHDQQAVMIAESETWCIGNGQVHDAMTPNKELAKTLNCMDDPMKVMIASVDCRNGTEDQTNGALQSMASNNINSNNVVRTRYTVRRLTPLECERLQGYPDGWTDIGEYIDSKGKKKQSSDAARYKALGNSIAIPPWKWVMKRLCACYERDATLASLFDGISGFPLIWTQLNGWGSVLWTSEIEDFPIAVCKRHFGDEATGERGDFYEATRW